MDLYCERRGPEFWAEPLNAVTSIAFLAAALAAWLLTQHLRDRSAGVMILISLAAVVGIGSFAFHTFSTPWAMVMDIVPILAFQVVFLWLYLHEFAGLSISAATISTICYLALSLSTLASPRLLNGSIAYVPTLVVLIGLAIYHYRSRQPSPTLLLSAAAVFSTAITLRSIDMLYCETIPFGTHYLWHLLNGLLLYLAMKAIIIKHASLRGTAVTH